jgi:hypothetical protein
VGQGNCVEVVESGDAPDWLSETVAQHNTESAEVSARR